MRKDVGNFSSSFLRLRRLMSGEALPHRWSEQTFAAPPPEAQPQGNKRSHAERLCLSAHRAAKPQKIATFIIAILTLSITCLSQTKPVAKPTPSKIPSSVPIKPGTTTRAITAKPAKIDPGTVSGRTYTNEQFGFDVTFPDSWLIPDKDFEDVMKMNGYNLHVADSGLLTPATAKQFEKRVTILLTAYRSMPGTMENGVVIVAVEDLSLNPKIKDAVDYFDAMRGQFKTMKLPDEFTYSETQAEKLGDRQFAFLDTSAPTGKKRMYARVRNGYAIMFTLSYTKSEDLKVLQQVLESGHFSIK